MSTNLMHASQQWISRPDDERFLTLADLKTHVAARRKESWTAEVPTRDLRVGAVEGRVEVNAYDPTSGERRSLAPTHWAFGQLSQYAGAPAAYLRTLPAELAAINLQYGLEKNPLRDEALLLARSNGSHAVRSLTSTSYGRIWDLDVVNAVDRVNADGRWQIPAASYAAHNPKRATTLYASDRDVFLFLVDPSHPIEVGGETLFRGFFAWNSEVGSAVFGLTTFLYRYVCDNRIVWGATDVKELRIRHTGGAPERFAYEGAKYLARYAEEGTQAIAATVQKAQALELADMKTNDEDWTSWLRNRGFGKAEAANSVAAAVAEEGQARSLWDIVQGVTAYARTIPHTDARVALETRGGNLLQRAAA